MDDFSTSIGRRAAAAGSRAAAGALFAALYPIWRLAEFMLDGGRDLAPVDASNAGEPAAPNQRRVLAARLLAVLMLASMATMLPAPAEAIPLTADLSVTKTDTPDPVAQNALLTYRITATYVTGTPADPVTATLTDTLPTGATFAGASPGCASTGAGTVTCTVTGIASGGTAGVTITVTVTASPGSTLTNTVSVQPALPTLDTVSGNNVATATTLVSGTSTGTAVEGVTRLGGIDRIATAVDISKNLFTGTATADTVLISRHDEFPDALAGTAKGIKARGPILLTPTNTLDSRTRTELQRVLSTGKTVFLLGGTSALSSAVESSIQSAGYTTTRLAGIDRIATAVEVSKNLFPVALTAGAGIIARHDQFPDALTGGPLAGNKNAPLLLTSSTSLDPRTRAELERAVPKTATIYILGGTDAISTAVENEIKALGYTNVNRRGGASRYDTSKAVADLFTSPTVIGVATGQKFPDALAGGVHIGLKATVTASAPIVITDPNTLSTPTREYMEANRASIDRAFVYGGTQAVSSSTEASIGTAIK